MLNFAQRVKIEANLIINGLSTIYDPLAQFEVTLLLPFFIIVTLNVRFISDVSRILFAATFCRILTACKNSQFVATRHSWVRFTRKKIYYFNATSPCLACQKLQNKVNNEFNQECSPVSLPEAFIRQDRAQKNYESELIENAFLKLQWENRSFFEYCSTPAFLLGSFFAILLSFALGWISEAPQKLGLIFFGRFSWLAYIHWRDRNTAIYIKLRLSDTLLSQKWHVLENANSLVTALQKAAEQKTNDLLQQALELTTKKTSLADKLPSNSTLKTTIVPKPIVVTPISWGPVNYAAILVSAACVFLTVIKLINRVNGNS